MKPSSVIIGLSNPKSPSNVGAIMRAAGCFHASAVYYTGERYPRAARFKTDTKNITDEIPLKGVDNLLQQVPDNTQLVCVELVEGAMPLPVFEHPEDAFYLFGPEDGTLEQEIVDKADAVVYVPTTGCLNLAATVNIVLYDRLAKSGCAYANDTLIRQSRDTNNRVKVRDQATSSSSRSSTRSAISSTTLPPT